MKGERPSALKTSGKSQVDPLKGSPVRHGSIRTAGSPIQPAPLKAARLEGEAGTMADGFGAVPMMPGFAAGSAAGLVATDPSKKEGENVSEEVPDSPPENSFECHACYKLSCKDCGKLPCVIAAAAAAAEDLAANASGGAFAPPPGFPAGPTSFAEYAQTGSYISGSQGSPYPSFGPSGAKGGSAFGSDPSLGQATLQDLFSEIRGGNQNVDRKFGLLQTQIQTLQNEISTLRTEMVTQEQFRKLEISVTSLGTRVTSLENQPMQNPEMQTLRKQLDRLDPAHKMLAFQTSLTTTSQIAWPKFRKFFLDVQIAQN